MGENMLVQMYDEHSGKVSDKWSIYLASYERLFAEYRHAPISMLEIGVQNGGSLEIWSEYFVAAKKFIGCDINPDCARLKYDDARISVIVGDANSGIIQEKILSIESEFDLIIDDGSHHSSDIIKSFAYYFSQLKEGGLFVIEDLHCSYWGGYGGGLSYPLSSMAFFKRLADIVNHESWGVDISRAMYLERFFNAYEIAIDEGLLSQINSVEFINSICVIRKKSEKENVLGSRIIAGEIEDVMPANVLAGSLNSVPEQAGNEWSAVKWVTDEGYLELKEAGRIKDEEIEKLKARLIEKNLKLEHVKHCESALQNEIDVVYSTVSWKVTLPLRLLGQLLRKLKR